MRKMLALVITLTLPTLSLGDEAVIRYTNSNTGPDPVAEQLRNTARRNEIASQTFGSSSISQYSAQLYDQGQRINRLTAYFSPQGIDVFNSAQLNSAVRKDYAERGAAANKLAGALNDQVQGISDRFTSIQKSLVRADGSLATQDKGTIREGESRIRQLGQELAQIEHYAGTEFKDQYMSLIAAPYLERDVVLRNVSAAEGLSNQMIHGTPGGYGGTVGLKGYLDQSANQWGSIASQIERAEDDMRSSMIQNYAVGGLQIVVGAVLTPAGGTGIPMLINGVTTVGMTARNNVVLNNRGLEGFQSGAEKNAELGAYAFQTAVSAVDMAMGVQSLSTQAGRIANPTLVEKLYVAHRYAETARGLASMTGVTSDFDRSKEGMLLDASLAAADLALLKTGAAKSFAISASKDEGLKGLAANDRTKEAARIMVQDHPVSIGKQIVGDVRTLSLATGVGDQLFLNNAGAVRIGMEAANLARVLTSDTFSEHRDRMALASIPQPAEAFREQFNRRDISEYEKRDISSEEAVTLFGKLKASYFEGYVEQKYPSRTETYLDSNDAKGIARISFSVNDPDFIGPRDTRASLDALMHNFRNHNPVEATKTPQQEITKTILVRAPTESELSKVQNIISANMDFANDTRLKAFDITTIERYGNGAKVYFQGSNGVRDGFDYVPGNDKVFQDFLNRHRIDVREMGVVRP